MNLDERKIKHLYARASFGLAPNQWLQKKNNNIDNEIDQMFKKAFQAQKKNVFVQEASDSFVKNRGSMSREPGNRDPRLAIQRKARVAVLMNWYKRMVDSSESGFLEKMCLFWHGHFATITNEGHFIQNQLLTFREHALGNFKDLTRAISKDAAMIKFLNLNQNKKAHPNENFARELLELFTIGLGNYTEKDIQEASRAFSGWTYDKEGKAEFRKRFHDGGVKLFMGKKGNFQGDDIIDIIFEKRETAEFIARKIYKFFVSHAVNEAHVSSLATVFYNSGYNIETMMRSLFTSDWFYDKKVIGTKIKSPIELSVGLLKCIDTNLTDFQANVTFIHRILGQELYHPPSVKGWDGGRSWINNSTLMFRMKLLKYLSNEEELNFNTRDIPETTSYKKNNRRFRNVTVSFSPLVNAFSSFEENQLLMEIEKYLINTNSKIEKNKILKTRSNKKAYTIHVARSIIGSPEYQMC